MTDMTVEQLKQALPKQLQTAATQELADKINGVANDPEIARYVRDNFVSYTKVLSEGRFKTEDYLNAITYVTFKLMGYSNKDAYAKTFEERYLKLIGDGRSDKEISAYVAGYHKNKLVNQILEQAVIPSWLVNHDVFQKAINTQLALMIDVDVSPKVRSDAANSLLTHLKPPETKKFELDVSVKAAGGIAELSDTLARLANAQLQQIQAGVGATAMSRLPVVEDAVVDGEFKELPAPEPEPLLQQPMRPSMEQMMQTMTKQMEEPAEQPVPAGERLSLFASAPTKPAAAAQPQPAFELKSPAANYAKCCESAIEDCSCEEPVHTYLPVASERGPAALERKGKSLFGQPHAVTTRQPFGGDDE